MTGMGDRVGAGETSGTGWAVTGAEVSAWASVVTGVAAAVAAGVAAAVGRLRCRWSRWPGSRRARASGDLEADIARRVCRRVCDILVPDGSRQSLYSGRGGVAVEGNPRFCPPRC